MTTDNRPPVREWSITVPTLMPDTSTLSESGIVTVTYDERRRFGFIGVPVVQDLRAFDNERMWKLAYDHCTRDAAKRFEDAPTVGPDVYALVRQAVREAWVSGYMTRITEERHVRAPVGRDQIRSLVEVVRGWPL